MQGSSLYGPRMSLHGPRMRLRGPRVSLQGSRMGLHAPTTDLHGSIINLHKWAFIWPQGELARLQGEPPQLQWASMAPEWASMSSRQAYTTLTLVSKKKVIILATLNWYICTESIDSIRTPVRAKFRLFSRNCCPFRIVYEIQKNIGNIRNFEIRNFVNTLIRIRICGSMPLTNGSGSGSFYFHHWPSRCQQKKNFFKKLFCIVLFEGTFTSFFKGNKSKRSHKTVEIKVFHTIFA